MKKNWLTVRNQAEAAEMIVNGTIGKDWWDDSGNSSKEFRDELSKIPKGKKVHVRINSEGGSVADALEIYNVLQERRADVTCIVDGYALSSASIVALGGGRCVMQDASLMMIHEPWSITQGDHTDHLRSAEMLDKHGETIAGIYAKKTGKPASEMRALMKKETWFTGPEAVDAKLADEADGDDEDDTMDRFASLDPKQFRNIPQHVLNMIRPAPRSSAKPTKHNMETPVPAAVAATPEPAAAPVVDTNAAEIEKLRKQLQAEKRQRITGEVMRRAENKIANDKVGWWINLAEKDEDGTYAQLDSLPFNLPGGAPLRPSIIQIDNRFEEIKKMPKASARFAALKNEWDAMFGDACERDIQRSRNNGRQLPRNENTYSSSLVTQFLIDGATTILQNRWSPLKAVSLDSTPDRYKPRATGQMKFVTGGPSVQTNATNFESGDATIANTSISVSQYTSAAHVTNDQLNSGLRMENLITITVAQLADKILNVLFTPLTKANYGTIAAMVSAVSAFGWPNAATTGIVNFPGTMWGKLKKSPIKNMVLDGEYFGQLINQPTYYQKTSDEAGVDNWSTYGWDGIYLNTNWTGTPTGDFTRGVFLNPQAIGAIAGLPLIPPSVGNPIPGSTLGTTTFMVPGVDVSVENYTWFSLSTRTLWTSWDLMFGSSALDTTAAGLLCSQ